MNITTSGHKHLGSVVGEDDFLDFFFEKKVDKWLSELSNLTEIARMEPHAAYCGFVHGFKHKLTYALRTTPGDVVLLSPLEDHIRSRFIPALTGRSAISDVERQLLVLPPTRGTWYHRFYPIPPGPLPCFARLLQSNNQLHRGSRARSECLHL